MTGDLLALTVDDGVNTEVVRLYTQFAKDTGVRLTYFVNGVYTSWTDHIDLLRPMVDDGQIQLANHTWLHPNLTKLPLSASGGGTSAQPRLPLEDIRCRRAAVLPAAVWQRTTSTSTRWRGDLGYTVNTLWSGDLEDQVVIPESEIVKMAEKYFNPQAIVIGHLNHLPVTDVYGQLVDVIRSRKLRTVTLDDVFVKPRSDAEISQSHTSLHVSTKTSDD